MGERLTDEQLAGLERIIVGDDGVRPVMFPWVAKAIEEIRERRAQDLTLADIEALKDAAGHLRSRGGEVKTRAARIINRIIAGSGHAARTEEP